MSTPILLTDHDKVYSLGYFYDLICLAEGNQINKAYFLTLPVVAKKLAATIVNSLGLNINPSSLKDIHSFNRSDSYYYNNNAKTVIGMKPFTNGESFELELRSPNHYQDASQRSLSWHQDGLGFVGD